MSQKIKKIIAFFKSHATFCVASFFAVISCFVIHPNAGYAEYIDWNTLAILFSLMATVSGLEKCGVFNSFGQYLCSFVGNTRSLSAVLVFLSFLLSMFITNDVALLTFVPFAVLLFSGRKNVPRWILMYVVVLQTVAANTGSMLTPIGNPQNLFIFNKTGMSIGEFLFILLPYTVLCGILLVASLFIIPKISLESVENEEHKVSVREKEEFHENSVDKIDFKISLFYFALFAVCILSVVKIIPKPAVALITFLAVLIADRKVLLRVDYFLLLTFVAFFIFSGNIAAIPSVKDFMQRIVSGNEFFSGIIVSQVISNVPATLMLYNFSENIRNLLLGVNIGGLGTLVASLASLISFNLYTAKEKNGGKFLAMFTAVNLIFLIILVTSNRIFDIIFSL